MKLFNLMVSSYFILSTIICGESVSGIIGDLDNDCDVDASDLSLFAANYGFSSLQCQPNGSLVDVRSYPSINDAVIAIGSVQTSLLIPNEQVLTASLVIPSNIELIVLKGGYIAKSSTATLTINGPIEAGIYQVFVGFNPGEISFGSVKKVYPEWWGENFIPGTTDMGDEIQSAIDSISGGTVVITGITATGASGWIGITLNSKQDIAIQGNSIDSVMKLLAMPSQYLPLHGVFSKTWIKSIDGNRIIIKDIIFDTNNISANVIGLSNTNDSIVENNYISSYNGIDLAFIMTDQCNRNRYLNNTVIGTYHGLILGRSGNIGTEENFSTISGNVFVDQVNCAINYCGTFGDIINNKFINCGMDSISLNPSGLEESPKTNSKGISIKNNKIYYSHGEGVNLEATQNDTAPNISISIEDNEIRNSATGIIMYQVIDTSIKNNKIIDNVGPGVAIVPRSPAVIAGNSARVIIEGNIINNSTIGNSRTQTNGIIISTGTSVATYLSNISIAGNICTNHTLNGIQAIVQGSPAGEGSNILITNNIANDNDHWGIIVNGAWNGGKISNNIAKDNDKANGGRGDIGVSGATSGSFEISDNLINKNNANGLYITTAQNINRQKVGSLITKDDTENTIWYMGLSENDSSLITAEVIAVDLLHNLRATYKREVFAYRESGKHATIQGFVQEPLTIENDESWNCTFDVNGDYIRLRVTGAVDNNVIWEAKINSIVTTSGVEF